MERSSITDRDLIIARLRRRVFFRSGLPPRAVSAFIATMPRPTSKSGHATPGMPSPAPPAQAVVRRPRSIQAGHHSVAGEDRHSRCRPHDRFQVAVRAWGNCPVGVIRTGHSRRQYRRSGSDALVRSGGWQQECHHQTQGQHDRRSPEAASQASSLSKRAR
jgi:hypothetical protein